MERCIAIISDLIFATRITGTAELQHAAAFGSRAAPVG